MGIRDTRQNARAIAERWPMSATTRRKIVAQLERIVGVGRKTPTTTAELLATPKPREMIAAARGLIAADRLNLEQIAMEYRQRPGDVFDDDYEIDLGTDADAAATNSPHGPTNGTA